MTRKDVLNFAHLILTQCDGAFKRDKKGYDLFDAITVRQILKSDIFGIADLSNEEIEYLRRKLLRYKEQIRKIALQHNFSKDQIEMGLKKLEQPVASSAIIIRGCVGKGRPYGRISLKWLRKWIRGEIDVPEIAVLNIDGDGLEGIPPIPSLFAYT